jgi:hypothetical protein
MLSSRGWFKQKGGDPQRVVAAGTANWACSLVKRRAVYAPEAAEGAPRYCEFAEGERTFRAEAPTLPWASVRKVTGGRGHLVNGAPRNGRDTALWRWRDRCSAE